MRQGIARTLRLHLALALAMVSLAPFLSGCQTPPDVGPFAESTEALHVVVASLGQDVAGELDEEQRNRLLKAWRHRTDATQAMAEYAQGLVAVVESGESGAESAAAVVESVRGLTAMFGVAFPGASAATEIVGTTVQQISARISQHFAARSVAEAIEYADPVVRDLAEILAADFATAHQILMDEREGALTRVYSDPQFENRRFLKSLDEKRAEERDKILNSEDSATREAALQRLNELEALYKRETAQPWFREMNEELEALNERFDRRRAAVRAASATAVAWGEAHASLARAAREGSTPSFAMLLRTTSDLLEAYAEIQRHD